MLKNGFHGFCMALADSVPGVSGGTVAFIMGFYDRFIGSINDLVFGSMKEKKTALTYLIKLGIGWIIGMIMAVLILTAMFESHIYGVSSLFIGFIAGAIPLIIMEEKEALSHVARGILFGVLGAALVIVITLFNNGSAGASMDLGHFTIGLGIRLFFTGMIAISAMFLPGISGSTLLLIFGAYIPVMTAIKGFLSLKFQYFPALVFFGLGILTGAATVVRIIRICLEKYRTQAIYAILGMMVGSFYAIVMGPTTLEHPEAPLSLGSFSILACIVGLALVLGMQFVKSKEEQKEHAVRN